MLQKAAVHRYYSTKVCERSKLQLCLSDLLVNIFSQHWKLYRSDGQDLLMKSFQVKIFPKESLLFFFQIKKI